MTTLPSAYDLRLSIKVDAALETIASLIEKDKKRGMILIKSHEVDMTGHDLSRKIVEALCAKRYDVSWEGQNLRIKW